MEPPRPVALDHEPRGAAGRRAGRGRLAGRLGGAAEVPLVLVSGLAEAGLAEAGLAEAGLAEAGLAEAGLAEAGLAEAGLAELGLAEAGLREPGWAEGDLAEPGWPGLAWLAGDWRRWAEFAVMAALPSAATCTATLHRPAYSRPGCGVINWGRPK
jgi:hypothetical protein